MSSLSREARRLLDWWIGELAALVPDTAKRWNDTGGQIVYAGDDGRIYGLGRNNADTKQSATILIPPQAVLTRQIKLPPMSQSDLAQMLAFSGERYFPMAATKVLIVGAFRGTSQDNMIATDIAALRLTYAEKLIEDIRNSGMRVKAIRVAKADRTFDERFDFLPLMRLTGLMAARDSRAANWWIALLILAALNVAAVIWNDHEDLDQLTALVDGQRPAVMVSQKMTEQMRRLNTLASRASSRRNERGILTILGQVTMAVPDGAWVQRLSWDGATLRLAGYRTADTDVAAALRAMPGVGSVKTVRNESSTEIAAGKPFDITVSLTGAK